MLRSHLPFLAALTVCLTAPVPCGAQKPAGRAQTASPRSYLNGGLSMLHAGNNRQASVLFEKYARLRPADPKGLFWVGQMQSLGGNHQAALSSYDRCLKLALGKGMDSAELRVNIGNTLITLGRVDDAIFNYKRAIEIDPRLAYAHFNLGRALIAKGLSADAMKEFNSSSKLGLTDPAIPYYRGLCLLGMGRKEDARNQMLLFMKNLPDTPETRQLKTQLERHM